LTESASADVTDHTKSRTTDTERRNASVENDGLDNVAQFLKKDTMK